MDVAVRVLCEFTAKRGDLDMRFTPSPSAQEGLTGHRLIAGRRAAGYQKEITLQAEFGVLNVRGRADGYDPQANQLEEFKTYRGDLARMPENHRALHWAQLRIYGWMFCKARGLTEVRLALVYLDVVSEEETALTEVQSADELEHHFNDHCERFIGWAESEAAHRSDRDGVLCKLAFPYEDFQGGQRDLAEAVYRTVRRGTALMAQAPTGIGKTIGTLFPALKAMPAERLDKLFFLVAKTSGRQLALDTLRQVTGKMPALALRVVELVAREKACEFPGRRCEGASCPLARGFYDRLPAARAEAMQAIAFGRAAVRELALKHNICPYYLTQELARWADVVVGDYNYYFDLNAMLYGWAVGDGWRVAVLVDEAHNLIERARKMYTAQLDRAVFDAGRAAAPAALKPTLERVSRAWNGAIQAQNEVYRVYDSLPEMLVGALERYISAVTEYLSVDKLELDEDAQTFFFEALRFCRLAAELDDDTLFEITAPLAAAAPDGSIPHSVLCLRNIVPRRFLAPRFAAAHATVLFSATLAPHGFYRDILGLPEKAGWIDVRSPFHSDQLSVRLVRTISTRYSDRERSLAPIADLVARQFEAQPGNYLAFFSSFDYLNRVAALVEARHPGIPVWAQSRGMPEADRTAYLARFCEGGRGVGFAVLGGVFAEGIDLPGSRLIGAFIATLGLPQVNAVNEETQRRMQLMFGTGYEYTYLYPGLQKVVQAAGRVIRGITDQGVLYLIDDRFQQASISKLLPAWWKIGSPQTPGG